MANRDNASSSRPYAPSGTPDAERPRPSAPGPSEQWNLVTTKLFGIGNLPSLAKIEMQVSQRNGVSFATPYATVSNFLSISLPEKIGRYCGVGWPSCQ